MCELASATKRSSSKFGKGEDLRPVDFRSMVRVIVDDVLKKDSTPSKKFVAKVAEQCVKKYPLLRDKFNTVTLGTGYDNLAYRLYTRVENVRRKPNSCQDSPPVKKRRVQIDSYGCTAFEPLLPEDISVDELLAKKGILQHLSMSDGADRAIELLKETYYLQRMAINKNVPMEELMMNCPILFTERGIEAHSHLLTDIKLTDVLQNTVLSKAESLLSFFRSHSRKDVRAFMVELDMNICSPNELLLLVLGLAKHFDESTEAVFFIDEVFNPHNPHPNLPKYPCLVGKGISLMQCEEFMLTIDGVAVNSSIRDITMAVASWFASYSFFNCVYPAEFACTLEFFQRCFVGINPASGSKAERRVGKKFHRGVHPKILNLLKKVNEFDSWVNDMRHK
ncbi:LOW QUALITY PROTEIN: uncharacterized protein LOC129230201 [Uloborus diversus]|uniref:LOW QUALITY PROTEIN: uncharacterized protein LOC129230201 n=1 Tax=Uloborus diversus TaxID=327109 RepID=UPI00240A1A17|nr:LOW QUALITY PROTEIN: uncharacterized protein LOC129230201 [Uloborus diversus]